MDVRRCESVEGHSTPLDATVTIGPMDAARRSRRSLHGSCEEGIAMIATLITVIILGVMVVVMFNFLSGSPTGTGTTTTMPGATTTTAPSTPEGAGQEAAVSACQANYQAIQSALTEYRSLNGSSPPAGTAWATATTRGGPYLQSWPQSTLYYSISWNGATLSVVPVRGAPSHGSDGTSAPKSGCFAA
ncbi:MAG: hypothetical protein WCF25_05910 [Acidimicrobiales bacterium]